MKQIFTKHQWIYLLVGAAIVFAGVVMMDTSGKLFQGLLPASSSPSNVSSVSSIPPLPPGTRTLQQMLAQNPFTPPPALDVEFYQNLQLKTVETYQGATIPDPIGNPTHHLALRVRGKEIVRRGFTIEETVITEDIADDGWHGEQTVQPKRFIRVLLPLPVQLRSMLGTPGTAFYDSPDIPYELVLIRPDGTEEVLALPSDQRSQL